MGAKLVLTARSAERAAMTVERVKKVAPQAEVDVLMCDLSSQASVRRLAAEVLEKYPRLDVLVNNAGAIFAKRQLSEDGIEMTWAVNHLAPYLLTVLLIDRLKGSVPARVITTSSDAHYKIPGIPFDDLNGEKKYVFFERYRISKLANVLFTAELARRLKGTGVTATCLHPGFVATGFSRNNGWLANLVMTLATPIARTPEKGAETLVWLVDSPEVKDASGGYYFDKRLTTPSPAAQDMDQALRLWDVSAQQTGSNMP